MPERRSMIESLMPEDIIGAQSGFLQIRPVVVDTSFLLSDVLRCTGGRRRSTFLQAVEFGALRPYAAHHVWAEMGRHVADIPGKRGLDPHLAAQIWWQEYVPRIRFVDVNGLAVPSADEILGRDRSDAPTFALAGLLAPVVVLAGDRDIRDLGVAAQSYHAVVSHAGTLTVMSQGSWGSVVALRVSVELIRRAYRTVSSGLRQPIGQVAGLLLGMALLLTSERWMPALKECSPRWCQQTRTALSEQIVPKIGELFGGYELATQGFEQAAFETEDSSLSQQVARALAVNANPMNRTQLARVLLPNESEPVRRRLVLDLAPILDETNAFSALPGGRWDLGRASVDFGGVTESAANLLAPGRRMLPMPAESRPEQT